MTASGMETNAVDDLDPHGGSPTRHLNPLASRPGAPASVFLPAHAGHREATSCSVWGLPNASRQSAGNAFRFDIIEGG
jgi:hypothetical protein